MLLYEVQIGKLSVHAAKLPACLRLAKHADRLLSSQNLGERWSSRLLDGRSLFKPETTLSCWRRTDLVVGLPRPRGRICGGSLITSCSASLATKSEFSSSAITIDIHLLDPGIDRSMAEFEECRLEWSWILNGTSGGGGRNSESVQVSYNVSDSTITT